MSDVIIHNININYEDSDQRVRDFVNYLKSENRKEELKKYFEETQQNGINQIYVSDKFGNEFNLECNSEHRCTLRLRGM